MLTLHGTDQQKQKYLPDLAKEVATTQNGDVKVPGDNGDAMTVTGKTVAENLAVGGYRHSDHKLLATIREEVLELFPVLKARLQQRAGTRHRTALFGLAPRVPVLAGVFLVVTLAALGLPGLNSFVGEFMVLLGAWAFSPVLTAVACLGLVLAPVYMLRLFQGAMYAPPTGEDLAHGHEGHTGAAAAPPLLDLRAPELALLAPLVVLMFIIGLYPDLLTRLMSVATLGIALPWQ